MPGMMCSLMIASGSFAATSSISMPPAADAMNTVASVGAVEHDAEIQFARDGQRLFNQQPLHLLALGPGLVRDQRHAQHLLGQLAASSGDLAIFTPPPLPRPPAWICALTTTPVAPSWKSARAAVSASSRALDHLSARHGHSVLRQDCLSLVLVNFHIGMTDAGRGPVALVPLGGTGMSAPYENGCTAGNFLVYRRCNRPRNHVQRWGLKCVPHRRTVRFTGSPSASARRVSATYRSTSRR